MLRQIIPPKTVLINNFIAAQITRKTHFPGSAKSARHGASHLRRNTYGPLITRVGHKHRFHARTIYQRQNRFIGIFFLAGKNLRLRIGNPRNPYRQLSAHFPRECQQVRPGFFRHSKKLPLNLAPTESGGLWEKSDKYVMTCCQGHKAELSETISKITLWIYIISNDHLLIVRFGPLPGQIPGTLESINSFLAFEHKPKLFIKRHH